MTRLTNEGLYSIVLEISSFLGGRLPIELVINIDSLMMLLLTLFCASFT